VHRDLAGQADLLEQHVREAGDVVDVGEVARIEEGADLLHPPGVEARERRLVQHGLHVARRETHVAGDLLEVQLALGPAVLQADPLRVLALDVGVHGLELGLEALMLRLQAGDLGLEFRSVGEDALLDLAGALLGGLAVAVGLAVGLAEVLGVDGRPGRRGQQRDDHGAEGEDALHRCTSGGVIRPRGSATRATGRMREAISIDRVIVRE
jgi:hypothetical protein